MDKHIYDLLQSDLEEYQVWYFPMDDSVDDETVIRPLDPFADDLDFRVIVATDFVCANGAKFIGYVYWAKPGGIDVLQPVIVTDSFTLNFWNGIRRPSAEFLTGLGNTGVKLKFPISFTSRIVPRYEPITGVLDGIYYFSDGRIYCEVLR